MESSLTRPNYKSAAFPKFARFQDFMIYYITQAHMCNISKHNNIIQYVNIENMGDREGVYLRLQNTDNFYE